MNANKDLQANHKMTRFLEEAKAQSEMVLDSLPGLFAVINSAGKIFRGNQNIANLLNVEFEYLADNKFEILLTDENWKLFSTKMSESKNQLESGITFQMELIDSNKIAFDHVLNIRPINNPDYKSTTLELFVITGNDVTDIKKATEKVSRMEAELQTAKAVQDTLFPMPSEFTTAKISLAGSYQPASECGGDWWFYNTIGDRIFLWIGDVTGHGVSAALVTSAARAAVSGIEAHADITPAAALTILNKAVYDASKGQKYMSFFVVAIDLKTGACTYASAAHELPFWIQQQDTDVSKKPEVTYLSTAGTSFLLGQQPSATFPEYTIYLKPGDSLFLYTDGITELVNNNGQQWGDRKVRQAILNCAQSSNSAAKFIYKFNECIHHFRQNAEILDDMTFFIFNLISYDQTAPKIKSRQTIMGSV